MGDFGIERQLDGSVERVKITGCATIGEAQRLQKVLVAALEEGQDVQVDLAEVNGIDLSCLQLLCAAHQSAHAHGKRFEVIDGGNEGYLGAVANAGFQRHIACARDNSSSCIWAQGES